MTYDSNRCRIAAYPSFSLLSSSAPSVPLRFIKKKPVHHLNSIAISLEVVEKFLISNHSDIYLKKYFWGFVEHIQ